MSAAYSWGKVQEKHRIRVRSVAFQGNRVTADNVTRSNTVHIRICPYYHRACGESETFLIHYFIERVYTPHGRQLSSRDLSHYPRPRITYRPPNQVFSAYAKKYAVTPEKSDNTQKLESTHGRGEPLQLQTSSRFGPCLSWTGFEGLCSDFQIAAVTTIASTVSTSADAVTVVPAARTAYPLSRSSSHRAVEPLAPLSLANGRGYWSPMEGYAISAVQTRVAFLSACTHNSVVASFADGKGVALRAENGFSRPEGGGSRGESDDEEAYWLVSLLTFVKYFENL